MCDFMRLFALDASGQASTAREKAECFRQAAYQPGADFYHDYAGRLLRQLEQCGGSIFSVADSRCIVREFWNSDLNSLISQEPPQ